LTSFASAGHAGYDPTDMLLTFDDRPSTSPLIERVWRARSESAGRFSSIVSPLWEMVVTRHRGTVRMAVRGPETRATVADCPADAEWFGIRFKFGTFMPQIPVARVLDRNDVDLPHAARNAFWLDGRAWEYPSWENAEVFVHHLVRRGLIGREPLVDAALDGREELSTRSTQRRFLRATGLTRGAHRQIVRARHVTQLLRSGAAIADAAHDAGNFDQAHLTRSVKRLIGQTPGQIARGETQLSFLYKTDAS
jgi:AraC-like DNA-binding protein